MSAPWLARRYLSSVALRDRRRSGPAEIRWLSLVLIVACLVQYLLAMVLNLSVVISRHHPGASGGQYLIGPPRAWSGGSVRAASWPFLQGWEFAGSGIHPAGCGNLLSVHAQGKEGGSRRSGGGAGGGLQRCLLPQLNQTVNSMLMAGFVTVALSCFAWALLRAPYHAPFRRLNGRVAVPPPAPRSPSLDGGPRAASWRRAPRQSLDPDPGSGRVAAWRR